MASTTAEKKIERLANQLADVEQKIIELQLRERRDDDHPLMTKRNKLIVELLNLDAGYSFMTKTRGVAPSTNRGLIRVLQGGKPI